MLKPRLMAYFSSYADSHRHPINRLTHKIAIPLIVFHVVAMLDWVRLVPIGSTGVYLTLGAVIYLLAIGWYLALNVKLAAMMAVAFGVCFPLGWQFDRIEHGRWIIVAIAVVGWGIQLAGHSVWEKNRPAFMTNMFQALIGPIFFAAVLVGDWPPQTVTAKQPA